MKKRLGLLLKLSIAGLLGRGRLLLVRNVSGPLSEAIFSVATVLADVRQLTTIFASTRVNWRISDKTIAEDTEDGL